MESATTCSDELVRPVLPEALGLPNAASLGPSFRAWRTLRRVKQSCAADMLGVSQATISRWESGTQPPSARQAARLRAIMAAIPESAADHAPWISSGNAPMKLT
jgi:transcriptional regulator with XRE-family HTH domain